jgi:hypothetical protein
MNSMPFAPNAIWWVQYRLLGGPTRLFVFTSAYSAILVSATIGCRQLMLDKTATQYADLIVLLLTGVQVLIIVLGATNAVGRGISRDLTTKMLESHRLSPMSNFGVMVGYLVGANLQMLLMYFVGVVFGSIVIRWGTTGIEGWLTGNLLLLLVAPSLWSLILFANVARGKPVSVGPFVFIPLVMGMVLVSVPGLGLVSGVYAGSFAVWVMLGTFSPNHFVASLLAMVSLFVTGVWMRAAMRKFRRPDLPAFGPWRGLGLLFLWLFLGNIGIVVMTNDDLRLYVREFAQVTAEFTGTIVIGTAAISMVVSIFPIMASVVTVRGRLGRGATAGLSVPIALIATALVAGSVYVHVPPHAAEAFGLAALAIALAFLTMRGLIAVLWNWRIKLVVPISLYVIFFWVGPPVADIWYNELVEGTRNGLDAETSWVFGVSPIAYIARIFIDIDYPVRAGLIFQGAFALLVNVLSLYRAGRRRTVVRSRAHSVA